ncbi:MAG: prephenate dehydrogenase, partial [Treponema sp.]|nr:prephenate dehydrogenase [Treponema sp.]
MKPIEECGVGIAGLGIMGGAFALAIKKLRPGRIRAFDKDGEVLKTALDLGVIDESCTDPAAMLAESDFVMLCLNPSTLIAFAEKHAGSFKTGALVTDIAGIKGSVCAAAERFLRIREDVDFIPGHPMAGAEGAGFASAEKVNFAGKNYILTPLERNKKENLLWLAGIIHRMGFGRITETSPEDHDGKIAFTSQLCHVIAAALIDCEGDAGITRYGGGSFEDLTRIAVLNAPMWTELFLENRKQLL